MKIEMWGTEPVPQGSKTGFVIPGTNRVSMTDSNAKKLKPFREALASTAVEAMGETPLFEGPCILHVVFLFTRPKSHYDSKGNVKLSAPKYKTTKPDLDKLLRAVGDAMTGTVVRDDSRFTDVTAVKWYSETPGVVIHITEA